MRAPYGRGTRWWKVKLRQEATLMIGGIIVTAAGYCGLLVGARVGDELRYVGTVEWGVRARRWMP
jgi:ATP-dependent DNA ligase